LQTGDITGFVDSIAANLFERILGAADREHPADAVLREALKSQRGLSRDDSARISHAVFAYYRWRGWLDEARPSQEQLAQALDLARKFALNPDGFSDADLLARAVPAWIQKEMEVTPAWARALQSEPKLWLRARRGQGRALAGELADCRPFGDGLLADTLEYQSSQDLFRTPEFHAGEFEVQDLSSQAVGLICSPQPGQTWWDACAGEGGKLLHLSDLMGNKGLIWASDRASWRLQRLKRRAGRAKVFNYRSAVWDGGPVLPTKTKFDGVLVDAPCSGVGTWHRNPHARWTTTAQDVRELGGVQKELLARAASAVKPGGKLVYAVCTLTRAETSEVGEAFEKQFPEFQRLPGKNPLGPETAPGREFRFWPQQFGGNGMFVACWVRGEPSSS
jgi:16S rRNA (cytosine967-C5)-methyltransferase